MCLICIELDAKNMSIPDARMALIEMRSEIGDEHAGEVDFKLTEMKYPEIGKALSFSPERSEADEDKQIKSSIMIDGITYFFNPEDFATKSTVTGRSADGLEMTLVKDDLGCWVYSFVRQVTAGNRYIVNGTIEPDGSHHARRFQI